MRQTPPSIYILIQLQKPSPYSNVHLSVCTSVHRSVYPYGQTDRRVGKT